MKKYLPVIRSAQLFSGISEEELCAMLACLKAEKKDFPKEAFVLHGNITAALERLRLDAPSNPPV